MLNAINYVLLLDYNVVLNIAKEEKLVLVKSKKLVLLTFLIRNSNCNP